MKDRYTVVVCANLAGEKEKLVIIGKSKKTHSFPKRRLDRERFNQMIHYCANTNGWQTSILFEDFLRKFNNKMKLQRRHILLLLDNCPSHPDLNNLSNIKLQFLPKSTTSKTQPLDMGVIKSLKAQYRRRMGNDPES